MDLELITLTIFGEETRVFRDAAAARDHILHHLLTAPECEAWRLLLPDAGIGVDFAEREQRARECLEDASQGQELYVAYSDAIKRALQEGGMLGLSHRVDDRCVWMGLEGVVVVEQVRRERYVRTAYIPRDLQNRSSSSPTSEHPLPRDIANWEKISMTDQERRQREVQYKTYPRDRLIFLYSFGPAVSVIQKIKMRAACKSPGEAAGQRDAEALLPTLKRLRMDNEECWRKEWRRLRDVGE